MCVCVYLSLCFVCLFVCMCECVGHVCRCVYVCVTMLALWMATPPQPLIEIQREGPGIKSQKKEV